MKEHEFMNEKEVSGFLGVAVQTLRNWRGNKKHFKYYKIGKRVVYLKADILDYISKNVVGGD